VVKKGLLLEATATYCQIAPAPHEPLRTNLLNEPLKTGRLPTADHQRGRLRPDFGVNRAIAECHAHGAVTSATLMAVESRCWIASAAPTLPKLSVGCHVCWWTVLRCSGCRGSGRWICYAGLRIRSNPGGFTQRRVDWPILSHRIEAEAMTPV